MTHATQRKGKEMVIDVLQDARLEAIRSNKLVGRGTLTSIDEAWTDAEIMEVLIEDSLDTPAAAIHWACWQEGLHLEMGLNQRWGEDDDPELLAWQRWQEKVTL